MGRVTDSSASDAMPLRGVAVLVTRPAARATALCEKLTAAGAQVHAAPMLAVEMLAETPALRSVAQELDRYDLVIVTSRHAVAGALPLFADYWPQWPAQQTWLAVGRGTADALTAHHIHASAPDDARSEGLLALPALAAAAGKRVLLLAGEGGRDLLETTLRARGADVTRLALYRRVALADHAGALDAFRDSLAGTARGAALVTSAEALQNLLAQAPWLAGSNVTLVVASERIAAVARAGGIKYLHVAGGAGDEQQLTALLACVAQPTDEDRA